MRKLIIFIASSLDGYIAAPGDDLEFLKIVDKPGEDYGYTSFIANVDTILLGRKTYDWVKNHSGSSHYDKGDYKVFVITRTERPDSGNTSFYTGDFIALAKRLKSEAGKFIYCDGGAEVIHQLLENDLVDEMIISVIPVLVGNGVRLFKDSRPEQRLTLVNVKSYDTGLVQLHYKRR